MTKAQAFSPDRCVHYECLLGFLGEAQADQGIAALMSLHIHERIFQVNIQSERRVTKPRKAIVPVSTALQTLRQGEAMARSISQSAFRAETESESSRGCSKNSTGWFESQQFESDG